MCGIVGAIAQRPVSAILLEGLKRLEYRGYDSAGAAVLDAQNALHRVRTVGKVERLRAEMEAHPLLGTLGIAHTRWATHGGPSPKNAHPHACRDRCAIVHNGIIENHAALRVEQTACGPYLLLPVTRSFIFLEEGDIAELTRDSVRIWDVGGKLVTRPVQESKLASDSANRGEYRHFMLKEIFEQPRAIADTLEGRILGNRVVPEAFGHAAPTVFASIDSVTIVACGTSLHAGLVARYWIESIAGLPCTVEVASEYRYRKQVVPQNALFVTISQSGETADTLAALRLAKKAGYTTTLAICNVPESSLVRESDLVLLTHAGPEIGVVSTKAFTTQLVALLLSTLCIARYHGLTEQREAETVALLRSLPAHLETVLALDDEIAALAERFVEKHHTLFLGRGEQYPIAMEGALKLKEISYIHAEAYPAGELKHGPLALIDDDMPVVAVAPNNVLLEKLKSNLEEVRARGGELFVFADFNVPMDDVHGITVIRLPETDDLIDPLAFTIPLQLLAYHVAVLKGTDVDQPRNLAKSVTVE